MTGSVSRTSDGHGEKPGPQSHLQDAMSGLGVRNELVRLKGILDSVNDLVVQVDGSGAVTYANPRTASFLGCEPEQLIGRPFVQLLQAEDGEALENLFARHLDGETVTGRLEARLQRVDDGSPLLSELRVSPIRDGEEIRAVCVVARKIHQRQSTSEHAGPESPPQTIVANADEDIMMTDPEGRIRFINRNRGNQSAAQLTGSTVFDHVEDTDHGQIAECLQRVRTTMQTGRYITHRYNDRDQLVQAYEASVTPIVQNDVVTALAIISREIEARNWPTTGEAFPPLSRLGPLSAANEIAILIAHEINQPIAAIANFSSACTRLVSEPDFDRASLLRLLGQIQWTANQTAGIVRRLRSLFRNSDVERTPVDVHQLIDESLMLVALEVSRHRVQHQVFTNSSTPEVACDAVQIRQVLVNLLTNACDALSSSETRRLIRIDTWDQDGEIEIVVADSGPGFDAESTGKLFRSCFTDRDGGMGIGLKISQLIVNAHGGRIWAAPAELGGAAFHFTLPRT